MIAATFTEFLYFPAAIGVILGILSFAWAVHRTQALNAWRSAAEGLQVEVAAVELKIKRTNETADELQATIAVLEEKPDLDDQMNLLVAIKTSLDDIKTSLDEISLRWG